MSIPSNVYVDSLYNLTILRESRGGGCLQLADGWLLWLMAGCYGKWLPCTLTTGSASALSLDTLTGFCTATPPLDIIHQELHSAVWIEEHLLII